MSLSVWTVKPAVLARLETLVPTVADLVRPGLPTEIPSIEETRRVYMLDVPLDSPLPVFEPGTQIRREEYVIPLALEVLNFTGNSDTGYADTFTLLGTLATAIENLCRADPSWGGACNASGLSLAAESSGVIADQGGTGFLGKAILQVHIVKFGG